MEFHRSVTRDLDRLNTRLDQLKEEVLTALKMEPGGRFAAFSSPTEEHLEGDLDQKLRQRLAELTEQVEALRRGLLD